MFWVHLPRCSDASFYCGHTDNIEQRLAQHHRGTFQDCYTYVRRPLALVWSQDFPSREQALAAERRIKGWSRAKKAALIEGDWTKISRLSQSGKGSRRESD